MGEFEGTPSTQGFDSVSPLSCSSSSVPHSTSQSLGSPPSAEIQSITDALQSLFDSLLHQNEQLEAVSIGKLERRLDAITEGSSAADINDGFKLIRRGISKRYWAFTSAIAEIIPQLNIAHELPLFIDVIFQATQKAVVNLETVVQEREAKRQEALELLRGSAA